jgi:hypothetical protein
MLPTCTVTGSFWRHHRPVTGLVRFTPERLWVVEDGITWATLGPVAEIGSDGTFTVALTPTDIDPIPWYYQVESPAGSFRIRVYRACAHYGLKELIDDHHSGARPPDR